MIGVCERDPATSFHTQQCCTYDAECLEGYRCDEKEHACFLGKKFCELVFDPQRRRYVVWVLQIHVNSACNHALIRLFCDVYVAKS